MYKYPSSSWAAAIISIKLSRYSSSSRSGKKINEYAAPSIVLKTSESSKGKMGLLPSFNNPAAREKLSNRPVFSHFFRTWGIVISVLVINLGAQNLSIICTWLREIGWIE